MPEPYIGKPEANVVILFSNPGISLRKEELKDYEIPGFKSAIEKNLTHSNTDCPYYYLDPTFEKTKGGEWIQRRMKTLIEIIKKETISIEELSRRIFAIQIHPYHSNKFKPIAGLYTQKYSMFLLSKAIKRGALIVFTRTFSEWDKSYNSFDNNVLEIRKVDKINYIDLKILTKTKGKLQTPRSPYFINNFMQNKEGDYKKFIEHLKQL